jgi:hypothetical protein
VRPADEGRDRREGARHRKARRSRGLLGRPDELTKLGPVETWRYTASNGEVIFLIVGDDVTLQAAGSPDKPK